MISIVDRVDYWATVAQLSAVSALTLVLEVRWVLRQWDAETTPPWQRRTESALYALTGLLIMATATLALLALGTGFYEPAWILTTLVTLGLGFVILAVIPIFRVVSIGYHDLISAGVDRLPWSQTSKLNRLTREVNSVGESAFGNSLEQYRASEERLQGARVLLAGATKRGDTVASVTVLKALVDEYERDHGVHAASLAKMTSTVQGLKDMPKKMKEARAADIKAEVAEAIKKAQARA
jgi:hypothetical protein